MDNTGFFFFKLFIYILFYILYIFLFLFKVGFECICIAFHPFGVALAAGSSEGHLLVLAADTGAAVATLRVCGSPLSCIGYNPSNKLINKNKSCITKMESTVIYN